MFSPTVRSRWITALLAVAWVAVLVFSSGPGAQAGPAGSRSSLPVDRGVNERVADFTLKDVATDRSISLFSFIGKKAVVLVFLGTDCPVGNLYVPRLIELNDAYRSKGVIFLGINSNAHETDKDVAKLVRETHINFPVLKDLQNKVSDAMLVERTCEAVVLDGFSFVRYRGAIDDQYAEGGKVKPKPEKTYLRDALEAILSGKPVKENATPVVGCLLDRVDPKPITGGTAPRIRAASAELKTAVEARDRDQPVQVGPVTFAKDVSRVIQNRCEGCHRPHEVGPFSLLTYDDARKHSAMIREVVDERRMPPWHADPRYGHFRNDRSLSAQERATLLAWVDQGTPLGDPKDLPPARNYSEGWSIGKPDVVFEMPETYYVPAQGVVAYVHFRIPTNFKEDRWVQAAEAVPGDPSVVHHIVVFLMDSHRGGGGRGRGPGNHFCGYAPGDLPTVLPEGTAKKIPVGADLIMQVHYTPNGQVRTDRSKVGLIFAKTPPTRQAYTVGIANPDLMIPAERDNVAVASEIVLPREMHLVSFMPHMHLRGKDFRYTITKPGEAPQTVLSVPAYDFGWQTYYVLDKPMVLPKGTKIDCLAHFDNSSNNPYNPDSKKLVRWGEQTFEEMMIGYVDLDVPVDSPPVEGSDLRPAAVRATQSAIQTFRRLGGNRDTGPNPQRAPAPGR